MTRESLAVVSCYLTQRALGGLQLQPFRLRKGVKGVAADPLRQCRIHRRGKMRGRHRDRPSEFGVSSFSLDLPRPLERGWLSGCSGPARLGGGVINWLPSPRHGLRHSNNQTLRPFLTILPSPAMTRFHLIQDELVWLVCLTPEADYAVSG